MEPLSLTSSRISPNPNLSSSVRDRANAFQSSAGSSSNAGLGLGLPSGVGALSSTPARSHQISDLDDVRITSPQELTQFVSPALGSPSLSPIPLAHLALQVDTLLTDLESRFDAMSTDVLSRRAFRRQSVVRQP